LCACDEIHAIRIVTAGHNLISNPIAVADIKRILEENVVGMDNGRRP
jgi:hypothetical protein